MSEQNHPKARSKNGWVRRRARFVGSQVNPSIPTPEGGSASSWSVIGSVVGQMVRVTRSGFAVFYAGLRKTPRQYQAISAQREAYERICREQGIDAQTVRSIRAGLRVEVGVFALFGFLAVGQIAYGLVNADGSISNTVMTALGVIFVIFAATRIAIALWRMQMHAEQRYRPISMWLRGH